MSSQSSGQEKKGGGIAEEVEESLWKKRADIDERKRKKGVQAGKRNREIENSSGGGGPDMGKKNLYTQEGLSQKKKKESRIKKRGGDAGLCEGKKTKKGRMDTGETR